MSNFRPLVNFLHVKKFVVGVKSLISVLSFDPILDKNNERKLALVKRGTLVLNKTQ